MFSFRIVVAALAVVGASGLAVGQEPPRDLTDWSITKRPTIGPAEPFVFPDPPDEVRKGFEGETKVTLCIDAAGRPNAVRVTKSSGHPALDEFTRKWVEEKARFNPAEAAGKKVAVCGYAFTWMWKIPKEEPPETSR